MIKCENVTFAYENEEGERKIVIDGLDLEIKKGSFTAILGRNGSGKSTLAKHFNAVLLPCEGDVFVNGINTKDEKRLFDIRKSVGMVFQNPDNQIVATSVEEDVAFGLENIGTPYEEMKERVKRALKDVGMYEYRKTEPHLLSGGQKQRVAIAGVIAMKPECIVFDEPTAMLDPVGRKEVLATIKKLNREHSMTIILITHYMEEAAKADRLIVLDKGKIKADASPGEVFSKVDEIKALGLDVPPVTLLAHELNKRGVNIPTNILRTRECAEAISEILGERQKKID